MTYPGAHIVLMTREPVPGKVKTRLIPLLGAGGALALFERLLAAQIEVLRTQPLCKASLWVAGDPGAPFFQRCGLPLFRQQGHDLGERMQHAAGTVLQEDDVVILIGSDCPGLDAAYLQQALKSLYSGADVVIGPATDGGYVLLGLRSADPLLFTDIDWGTEHVLETTLQRVRALGLESFMLEPLSDIDRPEDLEAFPGLLTKQQKGSLAATGKATPRRDGGGGLR